jgi:hypothetical protein
MTFLAASLPGPLAFHCSMLACSQFAFLYQPFAFAFAIWFLVFGFCFSFHCHLPMLYPLAESSLFPAFPPTCCPAAGFVCRSRALGVSRPVAPSGLPPVSPGPPEKRGRCCPSPTRLLLRHSALPRADPPLFYRNPRLYLTSTPHTNIRLRGKNKKGKETLLNLLIISLPFLPAPNCAGPP